MGKKFSLLAAFLLANIAPHAIAATNTSSSVNADTVFNDKAFQNVPKYARDAQRFIIPTNGVTALEVDGKVNLLSSNGRFIFQGTVYDTWAKKQLTTMPDIIKYGSIIPMKELNLPIADLQPAVWGDGPKKVMVFTDPECNVCGQALKQLADLNPHEYTVNVLSIGATGPKSQQRNLELYCAADRYRADRAIISHDNNQKFDQVKDCDKVSLARRTITAQVLGVTMVPFIIRDDGHFVMGLPKDGLKSFVAGN